LGSGFNGFVRFCLKTGFGTHIWATLLHEDGNLLRTITFLRNRETERKREGFWKKEDEEESSIASPSDLLPALYAFLSVWH
jgi:hypothetical protein